MKSEHRHDLETNWLAHHLAVWIEQLKPHTTKLLLAAGVVTGLLVVVSISSSVDASKSKAAWEAYALAVNSTDPELMQLQQVAEEFPDTTMQEWAYATWADRQLMIASSRYLIDREAARERLRKVQGKYEFIVNSGDPQIRDRAHFGLARVYEMLDQLDKAKNEYALVQGDLFKLAEERTDQLKSDAVQQSCKWLATVELPSRNTLNGTSLPGAGLSTQGLPGKRPPFEAFSPSIGSDGLSQKSIEELLGGTASSEPEGPSEPEGTAPTETDSQGQENKENGENLEGDQADGAESSDQPAPSDNPTSSDQP
ncbi:MAG: hypothetical protein ABGX16_05660 [Pirellulales bacterium]